MFTSLPPKTMVLFGTRPEVIKLAPVIDELKRRKVPTVLVSSGQHNDLLKPFLHLFRIRPDHCLSVMSKNQKSNLLCAKVLRRLDKVIADESPGIILVQGDTTTTLAGALAGFHRGITVAHVEAGLRSGDPTNPFPEEMNRRLVSRIASFHFAATELNKSNLCSEGIEPSRIAVTGNTVIDALQLIIPQIVARPGLLSLMRKTQAMKRILVTTHRRENFGTTMLRNLVVLRDFVAKRKDTCVVFPVHPNPNVRRAVREFKSADRIFLLEPLDYPQFIYVMKKSWLIVSDSGGVQEEAPTLRKPLIVLRENTERPEAVIAGTAKLSCNDPSRLMDLLEEAYVSDEWQKRLEETENPFGDGKSAKRIVDWICSADVMFK